MPPAMAVNANALSSDISRRNPQDEYELIQRIGSGTYGDVYKVGIVESWYLIDDNLVCGDYCVSSSS